MPLKRPGTTTKEETSEAKLKRLVNGARDEDRVTKEQMVEKGLVALKLTEYDSDYSGPYGSTTKAVVDLTFIDAEEKYTEVWLLGELGRQVGRDLETGELGLGRVTHGVNERTGRPFFGITWSEDEAEYTKAERVLAGKPPF